MMIPSQGISQVKFIVNGETVIGYTPEENRSIALLFLEGDKYRELYYSSEEIINNKNKVIIEKDYYITFLEDEIIVSQNLNKDVLNKLDDAIKEQKKLERKNRNKNKVILSSMVVNIILIICLI